VAGAAVCLAFHCRQNAVLAGLLPPFAVWTSDAARAAKLRALAWFGLGGIATWLALLLVVLAISDLHGYLYQVFVFPHRFAAATGRAELYSMLLRLAELPLIGLLGLSASLALFSPQRRLVIAALLAGVCICVLPPKHHEFYWVSLFPFIAFGLLAGLAGHASRLRHLEYVAIGVVGACVLAGLPRVIYEARSTPRTAALDDVAAWIDNRAHPPATLLVCGPFGTEYIGYRSTLLPANKYAISWEIQINDRMMPESFEQILDSYLARPPAVLVIRDPPTLERYTRGLEEPWYAFGLVERLVQQLRHRHRYVEIHRLNHFSIYALDPLGKASDSAALLR
jgi:hypothetical protein